MSWWDTPITFGHFVILVGICSMFACLGLIAAIFRRNTR